MLTIIEWAIAGKDKISNLRHNDPHPCRDPLPLHIQYLLHTLSLCPQATFIANIDPNGLIRQRQHCYGVLPEVQQRIASLLLDWVQLDDVSSCKA